MPDPTLKTISATEAPALLDASPYTTRWMLYRRFAHGQDFSPKQDNRMDWGKRLEPLVIAAAAEELALQVIPNRDDRNEQIYERRGPLGCTRDATIICPDRGPGALETKVVFDYGVWMREWSGGKKPPRQNEIQLQVQMFVGDGVHPFDWGCLTAWLAGDLHHFERKPIKPLWEKLEEEAVKFFDDVRAGREPDPFGAIVELPWLAAIFPTQAGKILDLDDVTVRANVDVAEKVRMLAWHAGERLGHEKAEKGLKAELLALAKDNEETRLPYGIKYSVQRQTRGGHVVPPHTATMLKPYVPANVPVGNLGDVDVE